MTPADALANTQQAEHWQIAGLGWVEHNAVMERFLAPISGPLLDAAFPGAGRRVLDVGCGCGATSLEMVRRLGADGRVVGIDLSAPMLEAARRRAEAEGLHGAQFIQADAQTADLGAHAFDSALSRFGVMFFEDPVAAFGNIRGALRPGGRLAFVCWRSPMENPFFAAPGMAAASLLPPAPPPNPEAPGQFAFADPERIRRILTAAGWRELDIAKLDAPISITPGDALTLMLGVGPAAAALREDPSLKPRLAEAMSGALEPYRQGERLALTAACWLVRAAA